MKRHNMLCLSAYIATACTALVWAVALALGTAPYAVSAPVSAVYTPQNARERFAVDLLAALGNTQPTAETIAFVVEWQIAEDGGDGALSRNNPLNTTMCGYNMTGAINGDGACGVQGYATYQDGLDAAVATLAQENFSAITAALQTNDPARALAELIASPWASSHYDGGAGWPHVELPTRVSAPAGSDPRRQQVVEVAIAQLGRPYTLGAAGPDTFDCSGLVQWSYAQLGVETTRTTFSQLDNLPPVEPSQLLPGDLIYEQFPTDQHVVMYAGDLDGDGTGDAINAGGYFDRMDVNILYDFFGSHPTFTNAIIGYRRVL